MTTNEILKRLDLKLGMKIIDTKPNEMINNKEHIYTLVKNNHNILIFDNSSGWYFQVLYVLTQLGKRFKVLNEQDN